MPDQLREPSPSGRRSMERQVRVSVRHRHKLRNRLATARHDVPLADLNGMQNLAAAITKVSVTDCGHESSVARVAHSDRGSSAPQPRAQDYTLNRNSTAFRYGEPSQPSGDYNVMTHNCYNSHT